MLFDVDREIQGIEETRILLSDQQTSVAAGLLLRHLLHHLTSCLPGAGSLQLEAGRKRSASRIWRPALVQISSSPLLASLTALCSGVLPLSVCRLTLAPYLANIEQLSGGCRSCQARLCNHICLCGLLPHTNIAIINTDNDST